MKLYCITYLDNDDGNGMFWVSNKRDIPAAKKRIQARQSRVYKDSFHVIETELPMKKNAVIAFLNKWADGGIENG